jgi:hypothetical protein
MNSSSVMMLPHGSEPPSTTGAVNIGEPVNKDVITNIWISTENKKYILTPFICFFSPENK